MAMFGTFVAAADLAVLLEAAPCGLASLTHVAGLRWHGANGAVARRRAIGESVQILAGAEALERLSFEWRALAAASGRLSVFQSCAWAVAAARYHEAKGDKVRVAVVRRDGRIEAILPVVLVRRAPVRVAKLLGDPVGQYGDALVAPDAAPDALALALAAVRRLPVDVLQFRRLRDDSALAPVLAGASRIVGKPIAAPFADLAACVSVDDLLLAAGGAKQRRERARSRRRLGEQGEVAFVVERGRAAIPALRAALALKRAWLAERGLASAVLDDGDATAMLERLAADSHEGDGVVAMTLTVGGEPAAYEIGYLFGGRLHAYLGAVADRFAGASPGKVLMEDSMLWCRAEGVRIYDLLPSNDDYKRQWSTGAVMVRDMTEPVTILGDLYAQLWLRRATPWLRRQADRLPSTVRRTLLGAFLGVRA